MHTAQQNPQSILNTLFSFDAQMSARLQLCLTTYIIYKILPFYTYFCEVIKTSKSLDSWKSGSKFSISI